jgi:hypothetical protein
MIRSQVEQLVYSLESQLAYKKGMLKSGYEGTEKLKKGQLLSITGAIRQLEADITAVRGFLKYRKKTMVCHK